MKMLTSLKVNGKYRLVDVHQIGNHFIEGSIDGRAVVLHEVGDQWYPEVQDDQLGASIQLTADVPEAVFLAVRERLDDNTSLTWDTVVTQALALWVQHEEAAAHAALSAAPPRKRGAVHLKAR
jgi:hypothetical protein